MRPADYLSNYLKEQGFFSIWSRVKGLNRLAIAIELGKLGIVEGSKLGRLEERYKGVKKLRGWGKAKSDCFTASRGKAGMLGIETEPVRFVIDLSLWNYHTPWEKKKLLFQIQTSIGVLRDFLWDKNLVLASVPKGLEKIFRSWGFFGEILHGKYEGEAILLDPKAEKPLKRVEKGRAYIIGGIVDRDKRLRTRDLGYELESRRIELKGSVVGVPEEINKILAILLKSYLGNPIEAAILEEMDKEDKLKRIEYEILHGKFRPWFYGINKVEALKYLRKKGIKIKSH